MITKTPRDTPFAIHGPALISFSGGRTSGYMLWRILEANGGSLPENVKVVFANTGKERDETLRFVHDCSTHWGVEITWVEWRPGSKADDDNPYFEVVGFNSASRNGEPFAALMAKKKRLPNWQERWCTENLKILPMTLFLKSLGWTEWVNVVGLRFDEPDRVAKQWEKNKLLEEKAKNASPWFNEMPLYRAGITKADVMDFWRQQPFDLQLEPHEGNCDACFLKGKKNLKALISAKPSMANWWIEQERLHEGTFSSRYSYEDLLQQALAQPDLFFQPDLEYDVECGDSCGVI